MSGYRISWKTIIPTIITAKTTILSTQRQIPCQVATIMLTTSTKASSKVSSSSASQVCWHFLYTTANSGKTAIGGRWRDNSNSSSSKKVLYQLPSNQRRHHHALYQGNKRTAGFSLQLEIPIMGNG